MKEISDLIGNKTIRKGSETKNHKLSSGGRTESTQISEEGQPLAIFTNSSARIKTFWSEFGLSDNNSTAANSINNLVIG
jgi:hypothetical protein